VLPLINGSRLHYEIAGDGPEVVLIHSGITDSRSWNPQFAEFAGHFRALRYDMRGFGESDVPSGAFSNLADLGRADGPDAGRCPRTESRTT
jgi:3-oxoadipate enol-lactonase